MLFYEKEYIVIYDCDKCSYTNIEEINIESKVYYATKKNLGCAGSILETKLTQFSTTEILVLFEARIDECDSNKIELIKYDQNSQLISKKNLDINIIAPVIGDIEKIWAILIKNQ